MSYYQLQREQILDTSIKDLWKFISRPENLNEITPKSMHFEILKKQDNEEMYEGMIIGYKVSPFLNIPLNWVTEITHVKENCYFVDEQRIGPYKMWHHQHKISQEKDGVLMTDIVTYQPPLGLLGKITNYLFIHRKLNHIFDYREEVLKNKFK